MKNRPFPKSVVNLALLALLAVMALALSPAARAADLTAADETELVAAITAVNAAGEGEHTITLTADITLSAKLPAINNTTATNILLDGDEFFLDADGVGSALVIMPFTTVTIRDLTVTGGQGDSFPGGQSGGGVANRGHLTMIDSIVTGNNATNGAGISNYGNSLATATLILEGVMLSDNEAADFGGGLYNNADSGESSVTLTGSTIDGNGAGDSGGGIANHGLGGKATIDVVDSTISGGLAFNGGGLFNNGNAGEAIVTLTGVTVWDNVATASGGGIYNNGNLGVASVALTNSTISGNGASFRGGGILNYPNSGVVEMSLAFVTVAGNTAAQGGGVVNQPGGSVSLVASILSAGEQGEACLATEDAVITSGGYNIDDDESCGLAETGDISGGNPALLALAMNAPGTTQTHAIEDDSDAHSRIPTGTLGCGDTVATDQRGVARPSPEPLCDIGAYESEYPEEDPDPVCEPPYLPGSEEELNAAIECVNLGGPGTHTITLAASIALTASTLPFDNAEADEIVLDGDGFILNGNLSGTVLTIEPETAVRVLDITITGGQGTRGPATNWGGGIYNRGDLTLENSTLSSNVAQRGGGIVNHGDGTAATLTVVRSNLSGNSAFDAGGGILNTSNGGGSASLNMVNSTLSGNDAVTGGGGLYNEAEGDEPVSGAESGEAESGEAESGKAESGHTGANLVYVTLAGNSAEIGAGGIVSAAGGESTAAVTLSATIISGSSGTGSDCEQSGGTITSTGYNIDSDNTCNLTQGSDQPAADAGLLPLALNAPGETATHALAAHSMAIDEIPVGAAGCGTAITTDQRGVARPQPVDGKCDIGAFEAPPVEVEEPEPTIYLPVVLR